jgi:hypothetical protein
MVRGRELPIERLTLDDITMMIGPVDFAKAKHHESLFRSQRPSLLSHHPTLQLPPDLEALRDQIENPGDCREHAKYQLLPFLGVEIPDTPVSPVPIWTSSSTNASRSPGTSPTPKTKTSSSYRNLMTSFANSRGSPA